MFEPVVIADFNPDEDMIELRADGLGNPTFGDITYEDRDDGSVMVSIDGNDYALILNTQSSDLNVANLSIDAGPNGG
ncbi:hypothetical protein [Pseudooctadecabacter sp.]|uniref:hypothetical protein n=1 Tax=Pseudooctadecabacter sp. TaxID=1966338 RepID=UPI0035C7A378